MFDDWFSGDTGGGYEVAEAFGGPQEDVVFQEFSQTGTLGAWEEARGAAIVQEALGAQIVADSLLQWRDAEAGAALIESSGRDYAERLAADLAKLGLSAVGAAINPGPASVPTVRTGAAYSLPQATRALFDKNQTTNTGFGAMPVLIGGLLLIGAAFAVAKLT